MTSEIRPGIRRLLRLVTRRSMQRDADEEIRLHLELRTKQLVAEGMTPSAARAEAELFGATLDRVGQRHRFSLRWTRE